MMSVTLANMGINPITKEHAFGMEYVKDVLAVMFTCGLYDYAGEWALGLARFRVHQRRVKLHGVAVGYQVRRRHARA